MGYQAQSFWDSDTIEAAVFTVLFFIGAARWIIYHDKQRDLKWSGQPPKASKEGRAPSA